MKLPVIRAFELTWGYIFKNFPAIVRVTWLPQLIFSAVAYGSSLILFDQLPAYLDALAALSEQAGEPGMGDGLSSLLAAAGAMSLTILIYLAIALVLGSIIAVGLLRQYLRDEVYSGLGYIGFGADEIRVISVSLILFFQVIGAYLISVVVAAFVGGVAIAALGKGFGTLIAVLLIVAALVLTLWLAVRLSIAIPATIAEQRIAIGRSFSLMAGNFWSAVGLTILLWLPLLVITSVVQSILLPSSMNAPMPIGADPEDMAGLVELMKAYIETMRQDLLVATLIGFAFSFVFNPVYFIGIGVVYRLLTQGDPERPAA